MTGYRQRAVRNTLFTALQIPVKFLVGLILPPYILMKIGAEGYGLWVLIMATGTFMSVIDAGVSTALVKYVAEYHAAERYDDLSEMVWSALLYFLGGGGVFLALLVWFADGVISLLFSLGSGDGGTVKMLLVVAAAIYLVSMVGTIVTSVLTGIQRMDISNLIGIGGLLINSVTTVVLLVAGWGLWALAAGWGMGVVASCVAAGVWVRRLVPELGLPRTLGFNSGLAPLFRIGTSELTVRLSGMAVSQLDKFLLGYFAGLRWVGFYGLAAAFVTQIRSLPATIFSAFVPMVSDLGTRGARESIGLLYARGVRYVNACGLPPFTFAVAFASPIVAVWLGDGYDAVVPALQIISVGNYLSLLTGPAFMMSLGLGQPKIGVHFSLVLAGFTVLLSPILIPVFGYTGALWSYSASASVAAVYLLWSFHGENRLPSGKLYFANVALPAVLTAALAFGVQSLFGFSQDLGRWGTGIVLAQAAAVFFPLSLLLMWRIQLIGREEWSLICDAIRVPRLTAFVRR